MNSTVYSRVKVQGTAHAIQKSAVQTNNKQVAGSLQHLLLCSISPGEQGTFLHM